MRNLGVLKIDTKSWISKKTVKLRHDLVKIIAPKLYSEITIFHAFVEKTPRPSTFFMQKHFGNSNPLTGVEVGVGNGFNALSMLKILPIKKLYLVDPYVPYMQACDKLDFSKSKVVAHENLKPFADRIVWIEETSDDAINKIGEELDFAYIDGNHAYSNVKRDMENYSGKVKVKGVVCGHDIQMWDVKRAVSEFCVEHQLTCFEIFPEWIIIKQ